MTSSNGNPSASAEGGPLPWQGQPYSIKRHGVGITDCDSEPVRTPGCIQAHGALLVLRPGSLVIVQASENTSSILGQAPQALIDRPVGAVIGDELQAQLVDFLASQPIELNPLYAFSLPIDGGGAPLDVTVHGNGGAILLEFEAARRDANAAPDYYALLKATVARLQDASTLLQFCELAAREVRALTGFDRVMVYKLHADGHGEVFAEDKTEGIAPWVGMHYPASDIPQPAREVFKRVWLRPTPDVSGELAEMVPLVDPETAVPLDMTYCALRGASVMYTEYLKNMKVKAGLTLSIRRDGELWGLVACHHYAGPRHVPREVRAACEFLAQVVSLQLRAAEQREHLAERLRLEEVQQQLLSAAARDNNVAAMTSGTPSLLEAVPSSGAALLHEGRWSVVGVTPSAFQLDALATWLAGRPELRAANGLLYATDHLCADYPAGAAFADVAAGLLALPLSRMHPSFMMWFRPETLRTIHWGGHPDDKPLVPGPNGPRLTPRASFELFVESVRERSLPWRQLDMDLALRLRTLVMELVVARAERLATLNAELIRSNEALDAFAYVASHDLKEPLRGIHKHAYQLLEDAAFADAEQRRRLEGVMRLTERMGGLLDSLLHFSRVGRTALELDTFDLNAIVAEAIEMVGSRSDEGKTPFVIPAPLPADCVCDWVQCREIYVNLLSNALKYNTRDDKRVEIGWIRADDVGPRPRCPPQAAGQAIAYVRDNGIGIDPRHFDKVFRMYKRLHGRTEFGGGSGVGLAIVKKLVERHGGQVWIDSMPGAGSTFYFTLPRPLGATHDRA